MNVRLYTTCDVMNAICELEEAERASAIEEKKIVRRSRREWTEREDEVIVTMHRSIGSKWRTISDCLSARSEDAVRNRWNRLMHKKVQSSKTARIDREGGSSRRVSWTTDEDDAICDYVSICGQSWRDMHELLLPHRSSHAIRNRFMRLSRMENSEQDAP